MRKIMLFIFLFFMVIVLILDALLIEPNFIITTTHIDFSIERLPESFKGFRIVHISDLHFGSSGLSIKYEYLLSKIRDLRPNIIVVTGDLISDKNSFHEASDFITKLSEISDVYLTFGNWDHWSGLNISEFERSVSKLKVHILLNENIAIYKNGCPIYIAGVDDPYIGYDDIESALRNIRERGVVILLAHSPQIIDKCIGKVDLILSGHTHGGQVIIPFFGPLFVPLSYEYRKFTYGYFDFNKTKMFVSRGIGTSIFPMRFLCPPEIVTIEFKNDSFLTYKIIIMN